MMAERREGMAQRELGLTECSLGAGRAMLEECRRGEGRVECGAHLWESFTRPTQRILQLSENASENEASAYTRSAGRCRRPEGGEPPRLPFACYTTSSAPLDVSGTATAHACNVEECLRAFQQPGHTLVAGST